MRTLFRADIDVCKLSYHWFNTAHKGGCLHWGKSPEDRCGRIFGIEMSSDPHAGDNPYRWRSYDPFSKKRGLFLTFAELEPTPDAIIAFASQYGCSNSLSTLSIWQREIAYLASAVEVWTAIQAKDKQTLASHVSWDGKLGGAGVGFPSPLQTVPDSIETIPVVGVPLGKFRRGDLIGPAEHLLDSTLGIKIKLREAAMVPVRVEGRLTLQVELQDLLDAMWAQLAMAVSESQEFRHCKLCEEPFQLTPDVNRSDRVFCSDTCRVKSYQRRQAKARKMRADGAHLRAIVKVVESDMKTVKRWLGEDK